MAQRKESAAAQEQEPVKTNKFAKARYRLFLSLSYARQKKSSRTPLRA